MGGYNVSLSKSVDDVSYARGTEARRHDASRVVTERPDVRYTTRLSQVSKSHCFDMQGDQPFLEYTGAAAKHYCVLKGKTLVGHSSNTGADLKLDGNEIRHDHCRITVLGQRVMISPMANVCDDAIDWVSPFDGCLGPRFA